MDVIPFKKENLISFLNLYCEAINENRLHTEKDKSKTFEVNNIILIFIFCMVIGVKLFVQYYIKKQTSNKAETSTVAISSSLV